MKAMQRQRDGVLGKAMARWHGRDGGAVALAALAACIILLMMGAALWDTGKTVRAKTKLQTATDSAAYTKAAIEARTMNFISFSNIAKRTVVGVHNSYHSYVAAWDTLVMIRCIQAFCCFSFPPLPCCNPCAIPDCFVNWGFYMAENPDYIDFSGHPLAVPGVEMAAFLASMPLGGDSKSAFGNELATLNRFQTYISGITPWWSFLASSLRGVRNGATVTTTWPLPPNGSKSKFGVNYKNLKRVMNLITAGLSYVNGGSVTGGSRVPVVADTVPVAQKNNKYKQTCSFPFFGGPATAGRLAEFAGNYALNLFRSDSLATCQIKPNHPGVAALAAVYGSIACLHSKRRNNKFKQNMGPFLLTNKMKKKKKNELARSTIVLGYKHIDNISSEKYAFNPEYESSDTWSPTSIPIVGSLGSSNHYQPNGVWSMARAEFTSPKKHGTSSPWMWTTGWTARMRPLAYKGEMNIKFKWLKNMPIIKPTNIGMGKVGMHHIFMDISPVMFMQAQGMSAVTNLDLGNIPEIAQDFRYMLDKASKSMDNETVHSIPK